MDSLTIDGSAHVLFLGENRGLASIQFGFAHCAYAAMTSARTDQGLGRTTFQMSHVFMHEDGSSLETTDVSYVQSVPNNDTLIGETHYTVVAANGRFAGLRGTFSSVDTLQPASGVAQVVFSGELFNIEAKENVA